MDQREKNITILGSRKTKKSPIDQGWAWVIMISCSMCILLLMGYMRTFGILYVEYIQKFNTTDTMASVTMGIRSTVQSITGLLVHNIALEFVTVRTVVSIGGFLLGLNLILKVFAYNMAYVISTECIIAGAAHGMVFGPVFLVIGQYFRNHRSFAMSFATSGSSLGLMIFAPLLRYLLNEYGFNGALLIYGAVLLNMIPMGCLLRPLTPEELKECDDTDVTMKNMVSTQNIEEQKKLHFLDSEETVTTENHTLISVKEKPVVLFNASKSCPDFAIEMVHSPHKCPEPRKEISCTKSSPELQIKTQSKSNNQTNLQLGKSKDKSMKLTLKGLFKGFNKKLFKDSRFWIIIGLTLTGPIAPSGSLVLPPLIHEKGISHNDSAILLTILAAVDFCSRLILGLIADRKWIKNQNLLLITLVIVGTTYHCSIFCTSFVSFVVYVAFIGVFSGVYFSLIIVVVIDIMGLSKLNSVMGFIQLYHGINNVIVFPIFGILKDLTGSYIPSFHFIGSVCYLSAFIILLEPLASRKYKRLNERTKTH